MKYARFLAMIATSTIVMFGLMYLNTYLLGHVFWSETRAYMALVMGAAMAIVMLVFMLHMYDNRAANMAILVGAVVVFAGALWLVRSQVTIGDRAFMRAMIPHHSIAIMTSSRADISDPRVRKLADEIIYAQDKEIAEMRYLIADIERSGDGSVPGGAEAEIVTLDEALSSAEIAVLDPEFMSPAEIARRFPDGAPCSFTFTEDSPPVLALATGEDGAAGLLKISGDLVEVDGQVEAGGVNGLALGTPGLSVRVTGPGGETLRVGEAGERVEADLILELERGLRAGYRGFYGCAA